MTAKYFHLGFNFEERQAPFSKIEPVINKARDWVRYAPNCYILYTTTDAQTWYQRLRKVINKDDSIFVVELQIDNRQGWLPKNVWDWIDKERP